MRIYLDDDSASPLLARLLRNAGHDVQVPADAGMSGKDDAVHLAHAVRQQRALLTRNYTDFENLHDLVVAVQGHHPGILVVRQDNDPRRDLTPRGIVRAIANLLATGVPVADQYIILNQWR
jgi:predicted nuclease of predicted toxin-antitoxin system